MKYKEFGWNSETKLFLIWEKQFSPKWIIINDSLLIKIKFELKSKISIVSESYIIKSFFNKNFKIRNLFKDKRSKMI